MADPGVEAAVCGFSRSTGVNEKFRSGNRLMIRLVSNKDIFLFKAIAGRDDDVEDMNMLVQAGLDYDVVTAEFEAQIDRLGDD
jgi:hypothetical protein